MGRIYVKFRASKNGQSHIDRGQVDTGSDRTLLNMTTACKLGFNPEAPDATILTVAGVGGGKVRGYAFRNVYVEANGRRAVLPEVVVQAGILRPNKTIKPLSNNARQLLGHDFLQASKSIVDFEDDELRGVESPAKAARPDVQVRRVKNQAAARATLAQIVKCPVSVKKPSKRSRKR